MPLFDYLCTDCGEVSEVLILRASDSPVCESCGGESLKKMISAHSSYSGRTRGCPTGAGDAPLCGSSPREAGCSGPGNCCGGGM